MTAYKGLLVPDGGKIYTQQFRPHLFAMNELVFGTVLAFSKGSSHEGDRRSVEHA